MLILDSPDPVSRPRSGLTLPIMKRVRFVLVAAGMLAMARPGNGWAQSAAAFARWAKIHAHRLPVSDTVSDVALEPLGRIVGKA